MEKYGFFIPQIISKDTRERLEKAFSENKIICDFAKHALEISEVGKVTGVFCQVDKAYEWKMQKTAQIIASLIEYQPDIILPIDAVINPAAGRVTKLVHTEASSNNLEEQANKLAQVLQNVKKFIPTSAKIIIYGNSDKLCIFAAAPLDENRDAWQKYLGSYLRQDGYSPRFYTGWLSNFELQQQALEKSQRQF